MCVTCIKFKMCLQCVVEKLPSFVQLLVSPFRKPITAFLVRFVVLTLSILGDILGCVLVVQMLGMYQIGLLKKETN